MEKKQYSSYNEIDQDLEVLKLERELHYRKLKRGVDHTIDQLKVGNLIEGYLGFSSRDPMSITGKLIKWASPLVVKFMNRKREGDGD